MQINVKKNHHQLNFYINHFLSFINVYIFDIISEYNKIKQDQSGDSFFIRSLFDRQAGNEGEISFKKDDILYIDNTLPNGQMNLWRAWLVDDEGNKLSCGLIPSKTRFVILQYNTKIK